MRYHSENLDRDYPSVIVAWTQVHKRRRATVMGLLLPDGFPSGEWLVLAEAAVRSPISERRIVVDSFRKAAHPHLGSDLAVER